MKSGWLPAAVLRAASILAPADRRAAWVEEWQSELWYVPRREAIRFCLGAFQDAYWLRRNMPAAAPRTRSHLESPLQCLAMLAALAALSIAIVICLSGQLQGTTRLWRLTARDVPAGSLAMLLFTSLLLPATRLVMGPAPDWLALPWANRLRRGAFMAAKIALVQPVLLCGFLVLLLTGPVVPLLAQFGTFAMWALTFRWLIEDQRSRCPVCLRVLIDPVRIGSPSETFLEWYGSESVCARGHGLLHSSESSSSYGGDSRWMKLDDSWKTI